MLQELVAKDVIETLAEDEDISKHVPMLKEASEAMRALHGEEAPGGGRTYKALMLGSSGLAAYGAYGLGHDYMFARRRLLDMLMRDKDLPKEFMGGKFADMVAKHKEEYIHFSDRPSPASEMAGDFKKGLDLRGKLSAELAKGGVSRTDALKNLRFSDRGSVIQNGLMVGVGALGWAHALRKQREQEAENHSDIER